MKGFFLLVVGLFSAYIPTVASCSPAEKRDDAVLERTSRANTQTDSSDLSGLFTLSDAEKILGEKAHLANDTLAIKKDVSTYACTYIANAKDQKTSNTGVLYVILEDHPQLSSAKQVYNAIKTANENHDGVKVLDDIGDEAYFHSDGNFCFILARKGTGILRMKVNKVTSKTSLNEFNQVAKELIELL